MNVFLFVGGPLHGTVRAVPDSERHLVFESEPIHLADLIDPNALMREDRIIYTRRTLHPGSRHPGSLSVDAFYASGHACEPETADALMRHWANEGFKL